MVGFVTEWGSFQNEGCFRVRLFHSGCCFTVGVVTEWGSSQSGVVSERDLLQSGGCFTVGVLLEWRLQKVCPLNLVSGDIRFINIFASYQA